MNENVLFPGVIGIQCDRQQDGISLHAKVPCQVLHEVRSRETDQKSVFERQTGDDVSDENEADDRYYSFIFEIWRICR